MILNTVKMDDRGSVAIPVEHRFHVKPVYHQMAQIDTESGFRLKSFQGVRR